MKQRILFVCLGNICRSPAAEAMMQVLVERHGLTERVILDSAGTYGGHSGERSDPRMRRAAEARGIPMTHRARQVREEDFERFDMLIAMDDNNYENLFRLAPPTATTTQKYIASASSCATTPSGHTSPIPTTRVKRALSLCSTSWRMAAPRLLRDFRTEGTIISNK